MVFYFSGSGNSYYAAKLLSEGIDTPLISIADALKKMEMNFDARQDKVCGFVMPIHFWGVPYIVTEFMKNIQLKTNDDTYVFVVFTCGGDTGQAPKQFEKMLKQIHVKLNAVFSMTEPFYPSIYPSIRRGFSRTRKGAEEWKIGLSD